MCICVCVLSAPQLLITISRILIPYDWLNKLYSFYVAAVVGIVNRCGVSSDAHCRN